MKNIAHFLLSCPLHAKGASCVRGWPVVRTTYKKHATTARKLCMLVALSTAAVVRSRPISMATAGLRAASEATIADYAARAEAYALGSLDHDVSQNIDALLRPLKDRAAPLDILDLCCAGGRDLVAFKKLGHRPIGLDGVSAFCEMAAARSGCEVWQEDLQQLDLPAERFDGIFANACLFHVPSATLPATLRALHGALKPGGVLFVSNAHGFGEDREGWTEGRTPTTRSYVTWLSEDTWVSTCRAAGLELLELFYRPPGKPRAQQPFLATVWRRAERDDAHSAS